jgi:beta-lactamase regulating signal transducer with metallopeptidase domain
MSTSTDLMTALAWSLLHFLWQGAAIAAFAAAAMQLFRAATTRYLIGILALALMCVSFGATFALLVDAPAAIETEATPDFASLSPDVAPAALPDGVVTLRVARPAEAWRDFAWLARVWLAGVCLLALRVAGGLLLLEHLRRRALSPLPVELVERCLALQRRLRISRVVGYCECRLVAVPSVLGLFRPIVLLPVQALTGLSAEQLEVVIAHELGHIKRFDVAVNLFQVVVETLFFFHPAVWWLNRRIRADREDCCDDIAISACGRSVAYARALAVMADWRGTPELTLAATGGDVASRVARLLGISRQPTRVRSAGVLTAALVLAASLTAGAASIGLARPAATAADFASPSQVVAQVAQVGALPSPAIRIIEPAVIHPDIAPSQIVAQVDAQPAQADPPNPRRAGTAPASTGAQPSFIEEMRSVGLDTTDVDLLIALKIHGVTADYVRRIRDAGLTFDGEEVIAMKIHGVVPEFIAQVRALGLELDTEELIAFKNHGVTPEFIAQVRDTGLELDAEEIVAFRNHGVTPEYIEQVRDTGLELDTEEIIAFRNHGVTPEYIEQVRDTGLELDAEEIIAFRNHGVTPEYIEQVSDTGLELDTEEIIGLKNHGITPEFINEARSHGFENLSVEQLIQLKDADVL